MAVRKKQYVVFGIGRFGAALCRTLTDMGHEVLAVDDSEDRVAYVAPMVTQAIQLDATDEEAFRSLGIRNFDAAVVSIGDSIRDSILISLLCKEMGIKYVIGRANDELHAKVLRKVGVDRVVFPERDMGVRTAKTLVSPHVLDLINLTDDYMLADITAPSSWVGHSLQEIDVRRRYQVSVLIIHRGDSVLMNLNADTRVQKDDALLILGHRDDITHVENLD